MKKTGRNKVYSRWSLVKLQLVTFTHVFTTCNPMGPRRSAGKDYCTSFQDISSLMPTQVPFAQSSSLSSPKSSNNMTAKSCHSSLILFILFPPWRRRLSLFTSFLYLPQPKSSSSSSQVPQDYPNSSASARIDLKGLKVSYFNFFHNTQHTLDCKFKESGTSQFRF